MAHSKIKPYSSYGVASRHGVDIESVDFGDVVAAVDRDSVAIRYGSLKIVFADFELEDENVSSDLLHYYESTVWRLVCKDYC